MAAAVGITAMAGSSAVLTAQARAHLTTARGQHLPVELIELGADGVLKVLAGTRREPQGIRLSEVLSIHGAVPDPQGSVRVSLVGGERLSGELKGGDADGETFVLESVSLGRVAVPVDRLAAILFRDRCGDADVADFKIPADAKVDEALFRRARKAGFSRVLGSIHRFRERSILFENAVDGGRGRVDAFRYDDLSAIVLRGGFEREEPPEALLLTRSGDLVGVDVRGLKDGVFTFTAEGVAGAFRLSLEDLASLTMLAPGRTFLSDLGTTSVQERAFFEDADVLLPHQLDRNVTGGVLSAGGLAYGKGIGVHSRSVLTWQVPAGVTSFWTAVGLDDSVRKLGLRASARVVIRVDDDVVFEKDDLNAADGAVPSGLLRVRPGATLTLEADFGRGFDLGDRIDWLGAVFLP